MVFSMYVNGWGRGSQATKEKNCDVEGLCGGGGLTSIAFVGTWTTTPYEFVGVSFDRGLHSGEIIKMLPTTTTKSHECMGLCGGGCRNYEE